MNPPTNSLTNPIIHYRSRHIFFSTSRRRKEELELNLIITFILALALALALSYAILARYR
ncbi:hypothetical protein BofuT4_uP066380.1 [Botrytis cinerea T4]|uniref:Uncharacterized protein n=1 Tax=Botryotinia fuckeliana (strain T4) TaxID=999810 RepID=G2XRL7_BOTF4|nr:hypothetical protein BofuT4_uP066380.1 [Botrytis cinerea T4]